MDRQKFTELVQNSKILFEEEKQSLLDALEMFPEAEMEKIYDTLDAYNKQDATKKEAVLSELDQMLTKYNEEIGTVEGLSEEKKAEYQHKGATLMKALRKLVEMI